MSPIPTIPQTVVSPIPTIPQTVVSPIPTIPQTVVSPVPTIPQSRWHSPSMVSWCQQQEMPYMYIYMYISQGMFHMIDGFCSRCIHSTHHNAAYSINAYVLETVASWNILQWLIRNILSINSLACGRFGWKYRWIIFKQILVTDGSSIFYKLAIR